MTDHGNGHDAADVVPAAPARRRTRIIVGLAVTGLLVAGGLATVAIVYANRTGAACVTGTWRIASLPFELPSGATVDAGDLTVIYRSDGTGSQTASNLRVDTVITVNSKITFRYSASEHLISYTGVAGYATIDSPGSRDGRPQTGLDADPYTCEGDTLTVNPDILHPEVLHRR